MSKTPKTEEEKKAWNEKMQAARAAKRKAANMSTEATVVVDKGKPKPAKKPASEPAKHRDEREPHERELPKENDFDKFYRGDF